MGRKYLMLKDDPVLCVTGFDVKIINKNRLPLSLRSDDVDFDRVFHGWTESRILNMSRTNAAKIMAGFRMSRSNSYDIAEKMHFATLMDCYWMKDESEDISWDDVSLYRADISRDVADTSLFGKNQLFSGHIKTPETSTLGLSAKAWYRDSNGMLWMYKVGRRELAAAEILDAVGAYHVAYLDATDELPLRADEEHIEKTKEAGEKMVKSRIITSENRSIATWYDYEEFCDHNGETDPYDLIRNDHLFNEMQVMDYILANPDRHGENWGFFMDADSGKLMDLHPLFDHDHAFSSEKNIPSQTADGDMSLWKAAEGSLPHATGIDLPAIFSMDKPSDLTDDEWHGVISRTKRLISAI